jgi:hypothetical protein
VKAKSRRRKTAGKENTSSQGNAQVGKACAQQLERQSQGVQSVLAVIKASV